MCIDWYNRSKFHICALCADYIPGDCTPGKRKRSSLEEIGISLTDRVTGDTAERLCMTHHVGLTCLHLFAIAALSSVCHCLVFFAWMNSMKCIERHLWAVFHGYWNMIACQPLPALDSMSDWFLNKIRWSPHHVYLMFLKALLVGMYQLQPRIVFLQIEVWRKYTVSERVNMCSSIR